MLSKELKEKKRKREQTRRKEEATAYRELSRLLRDVDMKASCSGVVHHDSIRLSEDTPRLRLVDTAIHMIHRLQTENEYLRELLVTATECSANDRPSGNVVHTHSTTVRNAVLQSRIDPSTPFYPQPRVPLPRGQSYLQQNPGWHADAAGTQHHGSHGVDSSVGKSIPPPGPHRVTYKETESPFVDGSYQFGAEYFLSDIEPIACSFDTDVQAVLPPKEYDV